MPSLRDVFRSLKRSHGLAAAAVICIALGCASTTAVATLTDVALIRSLPFPDADRLTRIWLDEAGVDSRQWLSIPEAQDLAAAATSFDALLVTARVRAVVLFSGGAERLRGEGVNAGYFHTLGLRPALGRFPEAGDHAAGAPAAMVLSHGTWMRGFGGDPGVVGRTLRTERAVYTIVGVAPRGFTGTVEDDLVEFWIPVEIYEPASIIRNRTVRATWTVARLKPGTAMAAAQAELNTIFASWAAAYPDLYRQRRLRIESFGENWRGGYRRGIGVLTAAAIALLAVAAINVGCLLLARVLDRRRELAVRAALGADRRRIALQLFAEALTIVAAGGLAGVVIGPYVLEAFLAVSPLAIPRYLDLHHVAVLLLRGGFAPVLTGTALGLIGAAWVTGAMGGLLYDVGRLDVMAFTGAVAALGLVALTAGLLPARRVAAVDPLMVLKADG
jgi:putative ABC transport system permease protein